MMLKMCDLSFVVGEFSLDFVFFGFFKDVWLVKFVKESEVWVFLFCLGWFCRGDRVWKEEIKVIEDNYC